MQDDDSRCDPAYDPKDPWAQRFVAKSKKGECYLNRKALGGLDARAGQIFVQAGFRPGKAESLRQTLAFICRVRPMRSTRLFSRSAHRSVTHGTVNCLQHQGCGGARSVRLSINLNLRLKLVPAPRWAPTRISRSRIRGHLGSAISAEAAPASTLSAAGTCSFNFNINCKCDFSHGEVRHVTASSTSASASASGSGSGGGGGQDSSCAKEKTAWHSWCRSSNEPVLTTTSAAKADTSHTKALSKAAIMSVLPEETTARHPLRLGGLEGFSTASAAASLVLDSHQATLAARCRP
ncbi:hypothetical protein JKP88DRAFT_248937 [Tribonema minus]|uniref:Uncharacterized protein n=1 Tax=Tribonema minus TaxID=303371 RepID=A0A835YVB8_9STRA|nr:hypothetical protein JKP88DRAFT_248937 [Tribonema minus]